jgi:hypothetical protein
MGIKQVLPLPGPDYSQMYLNQLVRALTDYIEQMSYPKDDVCSTLRVLQMPHSGYNLPAGSVWSNNGVLYVVELNVGYAGSVLGTTGLGTVTVVTSP